MERSGVNGLTLTSVRGNVKLGVDLALSPKTVIVGDNWGGKSAVVTAIELALTGWSSDIGATPSSIMELAPHGADALEVAAALSDGGKLTFCVRGSTARAAKPEWLLRGAPIGKPPGALLVSEVRDLLGRDAKRQREALLSICCGKIEAARLVEQVPDVFRDLWNTLWARARADAGSDADALAGMTGLCRAELRAVRAEAKGADPSDRPEAPSQEEIEALRHKAVDQRVREREATDAACSAATMADRRDRAKRDLPTIRARLAAAVQAGGSKAEGTEAIREALSVIRVAEDGAQRHAASGTTKCACCGGPAPAAGWEARLHLIRARRDALDASLKLQVGRPGAREIEALRAELDEAEDLLRAPVPLVPDFRLDDLLEARLRQAEQARVDLAVWEACRTAHNAALARADALAALSKVADRIVADALGGAIETFCTRASSVAGQRVGVQLHDGARAVCRVGMENSVGIRSQRVLSGAERALLLSGIAAAWGAGRSEMLRVAIVDEIALRRGLPVLCEALGRAVDSGALTQAIVCTVDDYGQAVSGWSIVNLPVLDKVTRSKSGPR